MTTPFPENNGWPYTTGDDSDYNQLSRFPEWSQLLAQKLYAALGAGEPTPGTPETDTGWITEPDDVFTPDSGVDLIRFTVRRVGSLVSIAVRFSVPTEISVPSNGNIANVTAGQFIDERFIPATCPDYQALGGGAVGRTLSGGILYNGNVVAGSVAGSSNVPAGYELALTGTYLV